MFIRTAQVCIYIVFCFALRVGPWRYFQLNARYFNHSKGIFSKLDIDKLIPSPWRLPQWVDVAGTKPDSFPVFLKPEWGQNSKGIQRADTLEQFEQLRLLKPHSSVQYLVQQGATQSTEFEIFIIPSAIDQTRPGTLSVTQVVNNSQDKYPINGIYNTATTYLNITEQFSLAQQASIYQQLRSVGSFNIARYGVRANSVDDLLKGHFSIIEINLFFPMPLVLLCKNVSLWQKSMFIFKAMWGLAKVTKAMLDNPLFKDQPYKNIFFKKMGFFYQLKEFKQKEMSE